MYRLLRVGLGTNAYLELFDPVFWEVPQGRGFWIADEATLTNRWVRTSNAVCSLEAGVFRLSTCPHES